MRVVNISKGTILAENAKLADNFFSRIKGLLGRKSLENGEALIIEPCNCIHMFFMRFAIDAVFVDRKNEVVGLAEKLKPFRLSPIFFKANFVIELPANKIQESRTQIQDYIALEE